MSTGMGRGEITCRNLQSPWGKKRGTVIRPEAHVILGLGDGAIEAKMMAAQAD